MNTVAMNNLWTYLQGLSLTAKNKKWLSERLIEPKAVDMPVMTDEEIANKYANMEHGDCKVILTDSDDEYIYYDVIEDGKVRWSSCTSRDYALQEIQR